MGNDFSHGELSSVKLLLLFQRLLLGCIYSKSSPPSSKPTTTTTSEQDDQHIEGAISVLVKYISMLHHYVIQVLTLASQLLSLNHRHFGVITQILKEGPVETLLPELSVGLVLLQFRLPLKLVESNCVPLVGELVKYLDDFNRLAPGLDEEDKQDLSWPDTHSMLL